MESTTPRNVPVRTGLALRTGFASRTGLALLCLTLALCLLVPAGAHGKRNVYVSNGGTNDVSAFDIGPNGALNAVAGSPVPTGGTIPRGVVVTPDAKYLYVANLTSNNVSAFAIATDGSLTPVPGSPFLTGGAGPIGLATSPDGSFLFAANQFSSNVSVLAVSPNGSLAPVPGSPFTPPGAVSHRAIAVSPDGLHLYVGDQSSLMIRAFDIAPNGSLAPMPGAPFPSGNVPWGISITPGGNNLYVTNNGSFNISAYSVTSPTGNLTGVAGSPFAAGIGPVGANVMPDGHRLYVATVSGVSSYDIGAGGVLAGIAGTPFAGSTGPGIASTPDGSQVYVSNGATSDVSAYDVSANGALVPVAGSPFPTGGAAPDHESLAITPNQPPVATFTSGAAQAGSPVFFDATSSTDQDGSVARYDWDFGDGTTLSDGGPTPSHTYSTPGTYSASVTLTDNEGCSTTLVFTGRVAFCNGSGVATASNPVQVDPAPVLKPRIGKVAVNGPARVRKGAVAAYTVRINNAGSATATGVRLRVTGRGIRVNVSVGQIAAGRTRKVRIMVRPRRVGRISASFGVTSANAGSRTVRKSIRVVR